MLRKVPGKSSASNSRYRDKRATSAVSSRYRGDSSFRVAELASHNNPSELNSFLGNAS